MLHDIEIQEVQIKNKRAEIAELMQGLQDSEIEFFDKTAPWNEIAEDYLNHLTSMQDECNGTCLVAYNNKNPVGFIFAFIEEQDESRIEIYTGDELYVSDGYVKQEYRRQGIYKKMNELLEDKYIKQGIKRITRFTLVNNDRMRRFLEGCGYKATRVLYEKWL